MIANALRVEIERYAARARESNALFLKAQDGSFTPSSMIDYLTNIRHLVAYTKVSLSMARDRARILGDVQLAQHFEHKRVEELGHEVWADNDIEHIAASSTILTDSSVLPTVHDLVRFLDRVVEEDPCLYLSYALFAEYLTVLLGPPWLALLEERCGIARSSMTVIGNHVEVDREHVEEALDEIDALVADPRKLGRMREVLLDSCAHFDRFCDEVTAERVPESGDFRDAAGVSAA